MSGRQVVAFGEVQSLAVWSRRIGIQPRILKRRLQTLIPEVALTLSYHGHYTKQPQEHGGPKSWTWDVLPWEDDPWAQQFVLEHPGGATLEEVGDALGVTRERVRQIEERALRKARKAAQRASLRCWGW